MGKRSTVVPKLARIKKTTMEGHTRILFCYFLVLSILIVVLSTETDTITMSQSIGDGETIVSAGGMFELGFFSPDNSTNRYLGIWYGRIKVSSQTVVWIANREIPLIDKSGVLNITNQGILVLLDHNEIIIWSSNSSRLVNNPVAQLLESGNLVVRAENDHVPENFVWQSFDYPTNTLLPGMKLGRHTITGREWYLSSGFPSRGEFTYRLDPHGFLELIVSKNSAEIFRSGPWNGLRFSGMPQIGPNPIYMFYFTFGQEIYYTFQLVDSSVIARMVLSEHGILQHLVWIDRIQDWVLFRTAQTDFCGNYAFCGTFGICNIYKSPICECLPEFEPKFPEEWDIADWSNGCVRTTALEYCQDRDGYKADSCAPENAFDCLSGDGFFNYSGVKLPDTRYSWFNESMTLKECQLACLKNCSCTAYANLDISKGSGSGCLLWFGDLIDITEFTQNGQEIYIRKASSKVVPVTSHSDQPGSSGKIRRKIIVSSISVGIMLLLGFCLTLYTWKKRKLSRQGKKRHNPERGYTTESRKEDIELPLFDLPTIANATNNFSIDNKLGEGGFGPVYKGVLEDGQEIAVKRLSKSSKQGLDEFMNEVLCIAKLQHRNLVKLLGCCIQEEKMLIYEYMRNKSLDFFIFDQTQSIQLYWHKRFHIINGIARGLLYLHQDSRLRIIHRDLKASNILLDSEMNPKISDFGLARSFRGNETEANTTRVVGTYGYMSPEYAINGILSVKSDVFSFGVLVLEIVSGKKNRGFHHPDHHLNLLGHAWKLYREDKSLELIDASIGDSYNLIEVLRSVHVGLLCVQRCPEDRPSMSSVVLMLGGESELPQSKQPGFSNERNPLEADLSSPKHELCSANKVTITSLTAR